MKKKRIIIALIVILALAASAYLVTRTSLRWDVDLEALGSNVGVSDIKGMEAGVKVTDLLFNKAELQIYLNDKLIEPDIELSDQLNGFGTYKLKAEYKGNTIHKKFTLVKDYFAPDPAGRAASLLLPVSDTYYDELDSDGDGLTDWEEVNVYGSDPYNPDTDGDGYLDNDKLVLGLDILEKDDFSVERSFSIGEGAYRLNVSGYGNIANVFVDKIHAKELEQNGFVIGDVLEITSSVRFGAPVNKASTITGFYLEFKLDGIDAKDDVGIFSYDGKTGKISWLESRLDTGANTIGAPVGVNTVCGLGYVSKKPDEIRTEIALVIDNSGSMFSPEYVGNAVGSPVTANNPYDYNNDLDFNRLSLMTSLMDKLEGDKFLFSVGAFQSAYYRVTGMTGSRDDVKSGIDRLKTEFQTFDGTSIETAMNEGLKEFSQNSFNKKFMILLTDGYSNENWYNFPPDLDSVIAEANRLQVEIITIGLGDCDEALQRKISEATDWIYVYAKDSEALKTLTDRILSSMKELELDRNNDGVVDAQMIADSGFKAETDGFPFGNFGDENSPGGNCYGFALTSKLIYEDALPAELVETKVRGVVAGLSGENSLKAYKMDEASVSLLNGNTYDIHVPTLFMIENPPGWDDLMNPTGDTGVIDEKYRQKLLDTGYLITVVNQKSTVDGKSVKKLEKASLDTYSPKALENVPATELDFIHIINRNQNAQMDSVLSRKLGTAVVGVENTQTREQLVAPMEELLSSGKPALVSMECSLGKHAVLVTSMAYDVQDPTKIIVSIYDSNVPDVNGVGALQRIKAVKAGEFYDKYRFEYNGAGLIFTNITLDDVELLNGDQVFYSQE